MGFLEENKADSKELIGDLVRSGAATIPPIILAAFTGDMTHLAALSSVVAEKLTDFLKGRSDRIHKWKKVAEKVISEEKRGEKYRQDGFLDKTPTKTSEAIIAIESILNKVWNETEEPKINHHAYLTVNMLYETGLDPNTIRQVLKYLDDLSYRQLCIIKICSGGYESDLDRFGNPNVNTSLASVIGDFLELHNKGLISPNSPILIRIQELYIGSKGNALWDSSRSPEYPGFTESDGNFNALSNILFRFANLDKIPNEDVETVLQILSKCPS